MIEKTIIEGVLYSDNAPLSIKIDGGLIQQVERVSLPSQQTGRKLYLAPGLIDNQVNGCFGIEFLSEELTTAKVRTVVNTLRKFGVTTFLPTLITASAARLIQSFKIMAEARRIPEIAVSVPGFHLEGPYISAEEGYRGAHNPAEIRLPDWDEFQRLNQAADGKILQITLAPELEGAIDFIRKCTQHGIVVALGHHNAAADIIKQAVDAGARTVTHLGNACANLIDRYENPFWMPLAEDRLMASLILDGFHLLPEQVKVFYKAKGNQRIILTSDMTRLAGMPPGKYIWDGKKVVLSCDGSIKYTRENVFAGASLPLTTGIENMMDFSGCSLREAIDMASGNPARLYGLQDRGSIEPGQRADLILFRIIDKKLHIKQTICQGKVVYEN
jgi:N-acetylglucosamine-6-phosphate deacetylase